MEYGIIDLFSKPFLIELMHTFNMYKMNYHVLFDIYTLCTSRDNWCFEYEICGFTQIVIQYKEI